MKSIITVFVSYLVVFVLLGCDQGGDLVALEHPESMQDAPLAKASNADDECGCRDIEALLTSTADFSTFTATGSIRGDLRGSIQFTGDPNSVAQITSATFPPVNPATFSFTGQLEITTPGRGRSPGGTLTTRGVGIFESGPFGIGAEFHRIVAGTGAYAGATGALYFNLAANENGDEFTEYVSGELCTPCDND